MKISSFLISLAASLVAFSACDSVSEDERFDGPLTVEAKKNVLIEDFTGQRCVNCPYAAETVQTLQDTYGGERVIAVAIHGGSLSVSEATSAIGLANEQGIEYNTHWGVESWPKGMVDRSESGLLDYENWQAEVVKRFALEPKADVTIDELSYDAATKQLTVTASVSSTDGAQGKLQVWLTESNIVRLQTTPSGYDYNYVHNHVFRASVNDPYGEAITLSAGQTEQRTYTYTLQTEASGKAEGWKPENMAAVVFFYNDQDGVMQVVDKALLSDNTQN